MTNPTQDAPALPEIVMQGEIIAEKYVVERVLGVGGMGIVVCAMHAQLGQRVAVKMMLAPLLEHHSLVERFLQEARTAVRLHSEHVSRVLDVGRLENGAPFIVMEYLEGRSLSEELAEKGRFGTHTAVAYVLQACEAVAEAHSLGMVHRDLKPDNLFLTMRVDGGSLVKVLDFGIAKATNLVRLSSGESLTDVSTMLGTPQYMAPEQMLSAKDVDARADIWSLGVVLYEFLTGHAPFEGDSQVAISAMVLRDEPTPIASYRTDVPQGLVDAIARCLQKDPNKRFASVALLADSIARFAPDGDEASRRIAAVQGIHTPNPFEFEMPPEAEVELEDATLQPPPRPRTPPPRTPAPIATGSGMSTLSQPPLKRTGSKVFLGGAVAVGIVFGGFFLSRQPPVRVSAGQTTTASAPATVQPARTEPRASPSPVASSPAPAAATTLTSPAPPATTTASPSPPATTTASLPMKVAKTWIPSTPSAADKPAVPPPPAGPVTTIKPPSDEDIMGGRK